MTAAPTKTENLGIISTGNALIHLFSKSADKLNTEELQWLSNLTGQAESEAGRLSEALMGFGCLIANDKQSGDFQDREQVSDLLFNIAQQVDTLKGMIHVGNFAEEELKSRKAFAEAEAYEEAFDAVSQAILKMKADGEIEGGAK